MKKQEEENKVSAPHLSFAAKWAPRERKTYDKKYKVVDEIASYMFPSKSDMRHDIILCSPMARISLFHREGRGSIPRIGTPAFPSQVKGGALKMRCVMLREFKSHCW